MICNNYLHYINITTILKDITVRLLASQAMLTTSGREGLVWIQVSLEGVIVGQ